MWRRSRRAPTSMYRLPSRAVPAHLDSLSAVDTDTDAQIRCELRGRRNRATTLMVSHRISTVRDADQILVKLTAQRLRP